MRTNVAQAALLALAVGSLGGCAEVVSPQRTSGAPSPQRQAELLRTARMIARHNAARGDSAFFWLLDPSGPVARSAAADVMTGGTGVMILSNPPLLIGSSATRIQGFTHANTAIRLTLYIDGTQGENRVAAATGQVNPDPENDGFYAQFAEAPPITPQDSCGSSGLGEGRHEAWKVINGVRQGEGPTAQTHANAQQPACPPPDECTNDELRASGNGGGADTAVAVPLHRSLICEGGGGGEPGPGGGGGGGGGSGGYYITVTECWGYDYYDENGNYAFSVVTGCSSYTYFVPNYQ